ncbi:uncharacterized protein ARMOST_03939 [Armillaria ostoyae]|uniref:Uncharacterized protein n=1 Tax=Armillaria ostoyae TaxID=47428 RepID=A0A284QVY3_ARMOS|nr:uncharacterized protein ARMOST_03939 [Armillaria ostoyae]
MEANVQKESFEPTSSLTLTMSRPLFVYLEPRPMHAQFGHSNYITLDMSFEHGPYIPNYSALPPSATDIYSLRSPALYNALQEFYKSPIAKPPPPSDLQNTWHFTAVRYRDTSALAAIYGLCMQHKFEGHLLMLSLGTLPKDKDWQEELTRIRSQGDVDISANRKAVAILVWSFLIDRTQAQIARWRMYSDQWRQVTEANPFVRTLNLQPISDLASAKSK